MQHDKCIALIGGDKRQNYIGEYFSDQGYEIYSYSNSAGFNVCCSLGEILSKCNIIILPIPAVKNINFVNTCSDTPVLLDDIIKRLNDHHIIFGGCLPQKLTEYLEHNNIMYHDFMADESVATLNSIATAEGAIMEAVRESPINIQDSNCLVTGYGKCAKTLSHKLSCFGANVTVAARKHSARCEARAAGLNAIGINDIQQYASKFSIIFNTVPALIITEDIISKLDSECIIIDIASYPGGTDFNYARKCRIKALLKLSIPGHISPKTSGYILSNSIEYYLKERL